MSLTRQYDRGVRVTIVPPPDAPIPAPVIINPILPPGGGAPSTPQIYVRFDVTGDMTPQPQRCQIEIHNLGKTMRQQISGASKRAIDWAPPSEIRGALVRIDGRILPADPLVSTVANGLAYVKLEAGYGAVASTLFEGQCTVPRHRRRGNTWVTTLTAGDSELELQQGLAQMSFPSGTTVGAIIQYLALCMGLIVVPTATFLEIQTGAIIGTRRYVGRARDHLAELFEVAGLTWWVEAKQLWILKEGEAVEGLPVICSPADVPGAHRLLETPDMIDDGGARIRTQLAAEIRPGRRVVVTSSEVAGTFRVEHRRHTGDNRTGPFETQAIIRSQTPL